MKRIMQITAAPYQQTTVILPDGSAVVLVLRYRPNQFGWFIESLTWKTFTLTARRVVVSPNLLHQYANQIPFGLGCTAQGNREPTLVKDFSSGAAKLYLLDSSDVAAYQGYLTGG